MHDSRGGCAEASSDQVVVDVSEKAIVGQGSSDEHPAAARPELPVLLPEAPRARLAEKTTGAPSASMPGQGLAAVAGKGLAAVVQKPSKKALAKVDVEDAITREELVDVLEQQALVFEELDVSGATGASSCETTASCVEESAGAGDKNARRTPGKVKINLDMIEVIMNTDPDDAGSPFVSRKDVFTAVAHMSPTSSPANATAGRQVMSPVASPIHVGKPQAGDAGNDSHPAQVRKVGKRKGTGFLTKAKLLEVLQNLDAEEDADEAARVLDRSGSQASSTSNGGQPCVKKKRQGTGFVRKEHLKQVLNVYGVDDSDDSDADSDALRT